MERAEWLKQMRQMTEALYDHISPDKEEVKASYERAQAMGLRVVYAELADDVDASYWRVRALASQPTAGELEDVTVYDYYPSQEQVREWIEQAGLVIEEIGTGNGYEYYVMSRK